MLSRRLVFVSIIAMMAVPAAEIPKAPHPLPPDQRFKTDILLIVAHPDDETEITTYLAKAIFDEHKRVSVIFGTRGNGGGNEAGEKLTLSITITNSESTAQEVTLQAVVPDGWMAERGRAIYPVEARDSYTVQTVLQSPANAPRGWTKPDIIWKAEAGGKEIGSIHMRVLIGGGGLAQ